MMAWASGVWRAISSSVISSDMPSCWGKAGVWPDRFPKNLTPGRGRLPEQVVATFFGEENHCNGNFGG
jgi:hypothetical protein